MSRKALATLPWLALLMLYGCASPPPPLTAAGRPLAQPLVTHGVTVQLEMRNEDMLQGDLSLDGSNMAAAGMSASQSMASATQGAASSGGGPAAGLGLMLGSLLAGNITKARIEDERYEAAEAHVAAARKQLGTQIDTSWVRNALLGALADAQIAPNSSSPYQLLFRPQVILKQGDQVLLLSSVVELRDAGQLVYRRSLEVYEVAVGCTTAESLSCLSDEQARVYRETLSRALQESVQLLQLDWQTNHFADNGNLTAEQTLCIELANLRQVERGRLISAAGPRLHYISLTGVIKSLPRTNNILLTDWATPQ